MKTGLVFLTSFLTLAAILFPATAQEIPALRAVPSPHDVAEAPESKTIDLQWVSDAKNEITDDEAWWEENQLDSPFLAVPNPGMNVQGNLPAVMPFTLEDGRRVVIASEGIGDRPFAIYGKNFAQGDAVLIFDSELTKITDALDFSSWIQGHYRIQWVQVVDGTLYFSYGINGYARDVEGETGFLVAYDLETLTLKWKSAPVVSNSRQFLIIGNTIISGYGFTAEPDFVHLLNRHNGEVVRSIEVASAPQFLIRKEDELFVRCYNRDYVFRLLDLD